MKSYDHPYLQPKLFVDLDSDRAALVARLNRVLPETTPGTHAHSWRRRTQLPAMEHEQLQYAQDQHRIEAMKPSMTLFPFSYDNTNECSGTTNSVSPQKSVRKDTKATLKNDTLPATIKKRPTSKSPTSRKQKTRPKKKDQKLIVRRDSRAMYDNQCLLDLYMAHPQLTNSLQRAFPGLTFPSSGAATHQSDVLPATRLVEGGRLVPSSSSDSDRRKCPPELSLFMPMPNAMTPSDGGTTMTQPVSRNHIQNTQLPRNRSTAHLDSHQGSSSTEGIHSLLHPFQIGDESVWHADNDEQLLKGSIFPEGSEGDIFSLVEHLEDIDEQLLWASSSTMW